MTYLKPKNTLKSAISTLAICALLGAGAAITIPETVSIAAWADDDGDGDGGKGNMGEGGKGKGGEGGSGQGKGGEPRAGQGEADPDSDGKGPRAGQPDDGDEKRGGKPMWAQEGLPEVEMGRLNVARSPEHVLDRAYAEAMKELSPETIAFYNLDLDQMIAEFSLNWDNISIIDSPLQNLSMFRDALDGTSSLEALGVSNDIDTLMAAFIGVASDKNKAVTPDIVTVVSSILGEPITGADAVALAADAEAVRIAVLAGHG